MKYTCSTCGKQHDDWPALAFDSPHYYHNLSDVEKETIAQLSSDFCVITYEDQTDRFIRCTLTQKVDGSCQCLEYGIWVSLSERSFADYSDNFDNKNHETAYFGYFCNNIPGYESTLSIPTSVRTRTGGKRPEVILDPDFDHQFVKDYYNGIGIQEAEIRINNMLGKS
jgi:hypothetical protein